MYTTLSRFSVLATVLSMLISGAQAQENPVALVHGKLIPITERDISDGTIVFQGGKIRAVGPFDEVTIPDGAEIFDVRGTVIMPGLVCTHSHVGRVQGGDSSAPLHPDCRVIDAIDVRHSGLNKARAGGLTTLNIMPGSGHLLSGQTAYVKLRDGKNLNELLLINEDGSPAGGIKMANGTNSHRSPPFPETRARSAALVRKKYVEAEEYRDKLRVAEEKDEDPPPRNLGLEALVEVLDGKRVVHHHTHRHDDILTVLRLKEEFGFRVVLHHVSDAWKVADEIAAAGVPCSIILVDSPGGKQEALDLKWESAPALEDAGVPVAFHTDDPINDSRLFLRSAALAVRAGMSRQKALEGVTLAGAAMLDLDDRIGSLDVGKDADLVILSGDPLSVYTRPQQTWVEGMKVFDIQNPQDALFATGGYGAGDPEVFSGCCFGQEGDDR